MDLAPAVRRVLDPGPDDDDSRADVGNGNDAAVLRNDLDHEIASAPVVAVQEEPPVALVEPKVDVDVAVIGLELDPFHGAAGQSATAPHLETLRVVYAGEWVPAPAVGRRQRFGRAAKRAADEKRRAKRETGGKSPEEA
jgi:hypothetical protein